LSIHDDEQQLSSLLFLLAPVHSLAYAALSFNRDNGFDNQIYALGQSLFFVSFCVFQVGVRIVHLQIIIVRGTCVLSALPCAKHAAGKCMQPLLLNHLAFIAPPGAQQLGDGPRWLQGMACVPAGGMGLCCCELHVHLISLVLLPVPRTPGRLRKRGLPSHVVSARVMVSTTTRRS
jgi:hypothetical protein